MLLICQGWYVEKKRCFKSVPVLSFLIDPLFVPLQFRNAEKFNQDLSFDTSGVVNMDGMCTFCSLMLACSAVATFLIFSNIIVFSSPPFCTQNLFPYYSSSTCQKL